MKFEKKDILLIAASIVVLAIMMTINVTIGVDPLTMQVTQNYVEAKAAEPAPEPTITPTKEPPQIIDDPIEEEPEEEEIDISSLQRVRCTCYTPTGNATASGIMPYEGICASNHEHMGWTARIYTLEGELIGDFVSIDVGGAEWLQNGQAIDIYRDDLERAWDWIHTYGDYVLIEWIEPEKEE